MTTTDPTQRFTDRVSNYVKFRPGYPPEVMQHLAQACHLNEQSVIADIGSGTGIFTKLLLDADYTVYAVEPNESMRASAEQQLARYAKFISANGTAEATTLEDESMDAIVCAQAFHWFNNAETKKEFSRILKTGGKAALIWNNRQIDADEFAIAYELLLRQGTNDYGKVNHQNLKKADFDAFFSNEYQLAKFTNEQVFGVDGLIGRAFSSSYVPAQDTEKGQAFMTALRALFDRYQVDGHVKFHYQTEVYTGMV
jgi:ubiquinone/menaquinone biosynthesis C-methylase UbiE